MNLREIFTDDKYFANLQECMNFLTKEMKTLSWAYAKIDLRNLVFNEIMDLYAEPEYYKAILNDLKAIKEDLEDEMEELIIKLENLDDYLIWKAGIDEKFNQDYYEVCIELGLIEIDEYYPGRYDILR